MYLRPQTIESRFVNPAVQTPSESQAQSSQQPYAMPMFEASQGVQAQSPSTASPTPQQGAPGTISPFELQPGTYERRIPGLGVSTTPGLQQPQATPASLSPAPFQQPQATPASVSPAPFHQPQVTPFVTPFGQPVQPVAHPSYLSPGPQTLPSTPGTIQHPAFQASQPQIQAPQGLAQGGQQPSGLGARTPRQPPMDIHDAGDELEIDIELPGVSKKDIHLAGYEQGLTLRAIAKDRETEDLVASERGQRIFQRDIPLGFGVDPEEVSARFENGVLIVTVPNKAAKGLGAIEIK